MPFSLWSAAWGGAALFANAASRTAVRNVGFLVAGVVLAFSIWQFREQRDRVRNPDRWFSNRSERDVKFLKRQAFRRLQLSGLAGISGALIFAGLLLSPDWAPRLWTLVWLGVLFFVAWSALLASVDAISIWLHFASAGRKKSAEQILLEYQMRQKRDERARRRRGEEKNARK